MTERQYDEILKSGLILFKERQLCSVPSEKEIDYKFSSSFEKEMKKLIRNHENTLWIYMQKTSRRVAVFILAILLSFTASLSIKAVREAVFDFFYRVFSDHTYISQQSVDKKEMTEYYVIPYIPNGFHITDESIDFVSSDITWRNNKGDIINFMQTSTSVSGGFDTEGGIIKETEVNGITIVLCDSGDEFICLWNENGYFLSLIYPSYLGEEYIQKIAGKLKETAPIPLS